MGKIGILGGTFDPIHTAHLMIAEGAADEFSLDSVFLMPTGHSPHKDEANLSAIEDRIAMIDLAIADNPRLFLSRFEIDSNETSYTYLTAERITAEFPDDSFYYIMGADSLRYFENWRNPDIIARHFHLVVAVRDGEDTDSLKCLSGEYMSRFDAKVSIMDLPNFSLSSTDIRSRVRSGRSIRYLTPDPVIHYIKEHHLYEQ